MPVIARALSALLLLSLATAVHAAGPVRFGPLPQEGKDKLPEDYIPPMHYLKEVTGKTFQLVSTSSYDDLIARIKKGEVDLAFLGPLPYATLTADFHDAVPLVLFLEDDGKPTYTCALIGRSDTPKKLATLRGKPLGLPQNLSTCGPLGADEMLRLNGSSLDAMESRIAGSHDKVAIGVATGEFELGSLKTAIARRHTALGIRILAESSPKPGFVLVANARTLDAETIRVIREAMLRLTPRTRPEHAKITRTWGPGMRHGAVPAKDSDFNVIRRQLGQPALKARKP